MKGCGNTYIHDSIISAVSKESYDLVIVMWTDFKRLDFKISEQQRSAKVGDEDLTINPYRNYIERDWISPWSTFRNPVMHQRVQNLFDQQYSFSSNNSLIYSNLIKIISLQSVLKAQGIPYVFCFYKKPVGFHRFANLYNMIDQTKVHDKHLYTLAKQNDWWDPVIAHPTGSAYQLYADLLVEFIDKENLVRF
jgi:hypothetical protein